MLGRKHKIFQFYYYFVASIAPNGGYVPCVACDMPTCVQGGLLISDGLLPEGHVLRVRAVQRAGQLRGAAQPATCKSAPPLSL